MSVSAVNIFKEQPATQAYRNEIGKWGGYVQSGEVTTSGPKSRKRVSTYVSSDRKIPTNYSTARQTMGGYYTDVGKYQDGSKTLPDGSISPYYTKFWQQGPNSSALRSFHEGDHFGVFQMYKGTEQAFMQVPSRLLVPVSNKLLGKIDDQTIDIGTMVAEMRGTIKYGTSLIKPLAQFGHAILTGRYNKAVKKLGVPRKRWDRFSRLQARDAIGVATSHVASRWTEFNFAIKPTLVDINGLTNLYTDPVKELGSVKMRASTSISVHEERDFHSEPNGWIHRDKAVLNGFTRMVAVYTVTNAETVAAKALGINNLASSLYNAVPFSWLVDYVFNVGEFLSLISATDGLNFSYGYYSGRYNQQTRVNRKYDKHNENDAGFRSTSYEGGGFADGYVRQRMYSFPRPLIQFVLPELSLRQGSLALSVGFLLKRSAIKVGHY